MSDSVAVVWDDTLLSYTMGGDHPMHPVRLDLTIRLAGSLGVLGRRGVEVTGPPRKVQVTGAAKLVVERTLNWLFADANQVSRKLPFVETMLLMDTVFVAGVITEEVIPTKFIR